MNKEKHPLGIFAGETLRKFMLEYPELPIVFKAYTGDFTGEYDYEYASSVTARIGEILDCYQDVEELVVFSDRKVFEDSIRENLSYSLTDDEIEKEVSSTLAEYEPYWKKCIIVTVGN